MLGNYWFESSLDGYALEPHRQRSGWSRSLHNGKGCVPQKSLSLADTNATLEKAQGGSRGW